MLRFSAFKQAWPQPVDLLFHTPMSPRYSDSISGTTCHTPSPRSVSPSSSTDLDTVEQKSGYPGDDLSSPTSFRLLRIHPALHRKGAISCTLQSVDLADHPRYRALSYTSGPAVRTIGPESEPPSSDEDRQILCNDQVLVVTKNLHDALVEFCEQGFTDWLWVEAICIDQSNAEERASHVSMMGRIYMSSIETITWLGNDESGVEDIQWGIDVMIPKMLQRGSAFWYSRPLADPELENVFGVEDLNHRLIGIKTFLATHRWFGNAWAVQEVALAPSVCLRTGRQQFSWTDLTNLSIVLAKVSWEDELLPKSPELDKNYSAAKTFLANVHGLRDIISHKGACHISRPAPELRETYRFLQSRYGTKTVLEVATAWTAHLLSLVRNLETSEKHDKIYSILGVANFFSSKISELVTPDYCKPVEMVYTSLTAALLLNSRYLSILAHVGDISNNQLTDLPSWVVDYSSARATNPIVELGRGQPTHFDASLTSEMSSYPRKIEKTRLTLIGARFDALTMVSPTTLDRVIEDVSEFEDFLEFATHLPDCYFDGQHRTDVLWRAMMMDSEETAESINHPPPSSFARGFQAWIINLIGLWVANSLNIGVEADSANECARQFYARLYPDSQIEVPDEIEADEEAFTTYYRKRMASFVNSVRDKVYGRKLFATKDHLIGMGSCSIQADDEVWLIRDSRTPLILRPKPGTDDFVLVGEAYLHGFMHGEMLDDRWELTRRIGPVTIV